MPTPQSAYDHIYQVLVNKEKVDIECPPTAIQKLRAGLNRSRARYQQNLDVLGSEETAPQYSLDYNDERQTARITIKSSKTGEFKIL